MWGPAALGMQGEGDSQLGATGVHGSDVVVGVQGGGLALCLPVEDGPDGGAELGAMLGRALQLRIQQPLQLLSLQ